MQISPLNGNGGIVPPWLREPKVPLEPPVEPLPGPVDEEIVWILPFPSPQPVVDESELARGA